MQKLVFISVFAVICGTVLTEEHERTWNIRQKRMTDDECLSLLHNPEKKLPSCCKMPDILPGTDNAREKCFEVLKQFMDKPETKEHKEMVHSKGPPCLFQCIFNQTGLADSDGKLNEAMITKKMYEGLNNDGSWNSMWQPTLNKCFNDVKNEDQKNIPIMNTPAGKLMKCFLRDLYMNCPQNVWVGSSGCMDIKTLVEKCPDVPPPVFLPPPKLI